MRKGMFRVMAVALLGGVWSLGGCQVIKDSEGVQRSVEARTMATSALASLKGAYATKPDDTGYKAAIGKYNAAATGVNAWIDGQKSRLDGGESLPIAIPAESFNEKDKLVQAFLEDAKNKV